MKHISIGGLDVSRIGLGAMSMAGYYNIGAGSEAESISTIHRALDLGVTHIDTAEIYGPYANEELVGRAIKGRRLLRSPMGSRVAQIGKADSGVQRIVGYSSASQFTREYGRFFGSAPTKDINRLREQGLASADAPV